MFGNEQRFSNATSTTVSIPGQRLHLARAPAQDQNPRPVVVEGGVAVSPSVPSTLISFDGAVYTDGKMLPPSASGPGQPARA